MKTLKLLVKIIGQFLFVIIFLSTTPVKSLDKYDNAVNFSDYFSGILLLNDNKYEDSFKYLKRLNGLEASHLNYSNKYLYSLINSGNFKTAFNYSKKLERQNLGNFESHLISGIYYLKKSNLELAQKYFLKAKKKNPEFILNNFVSNSLINWSALSNLNQSKIELEKLDKRFVNLKKIQNVFLSCYFNSTNTVRLFKEITSDKNTDFSRYNYFYASYMASIGKLKDAKEIISLALELYPRNLMLNQFQIDLKEKKNLTIFNCKEANHVVAEILYITANALSSQSIYQLSNFYLNLAKYLNEDFHSYNTLLAENFYKDNNYEEAEKIYHNLKKNGEAYNWYSSKQLARILIQKKDKNKAVELIKRSYENLLNKGIYQTFDYAEFLKNNEKFNQSIPQYTKIINQISKQHPLFAESTDGRGVAYERIGKWREAEKDLLASLDADPEQAYVINYLAYSWIEQGVKIQKSLSMLEKANELRSNDPYIIDSLGWALYKLERYKESKKFLQSAVRLMPADPIVNDHYGDVLWKNGNEIQARYYWNYVLNLKETKDELKKTIEKKLIGGL
tara:strand:- start:3277 stop:4965 length:1689 start_codon:yes stop_codon:yes gene_type:complete